MIILAGVVVLTITKNNPFEKAKEAKFRHDFNAVYEEVNAYILTQKQYEINYYGEDGDEYLTDAYPFSSYFNGEERESIKNGTLATEILRITGKESISECNSIYFVDLEKIGVSSNNRTYILDVENMQLYDYYGDKIYGKMWHTLDGGVEEVLPDVSEEVTDGWILLDLYYPAGATEKMWRMSEEGEVRQDATLSWKDYTGPILVPYTRVKDVWIKYVLDGKEVIVAPDGRVVVDIEPDFSNKDKVTVKINFDSKASVKEYKVGKSDWKTYEGPFEVTENVLIEARAKRTDDIGGGITVDKALSQ